MEPSFERNLHNHLESKAKLNESTCLIPKQPSFLLLEMFFQLTQLNLFWSPYLPHRKSRWIFIIAFSTNLEMLKKGNSQIDILDKVELINVSLPPIGNCLTFYKVNLDLSLLIRGRHSSFLLGLILIETSQIVKRKGTNQTRYEKGILFNKINYKLRPKSLLLDKFTFRPDAISKPLKMAMRLH